MKINLFCVTRNNSYDRQLSILRFVQKINQKNCIYLDLKFIGDSAPNLLKFFRQSYTPSSWINDLNTGRKYFLSNIENILDKERESLAIDQIFHKRLLSNPEHDVLLKHFRCINEASKSNVNSLIIEDDALLPDELLMQFIQVIEKFKGGNNIFHDLCEYPSFLDLQLIRNVDINQKFSHFNLDIAIVRTLCAYLISPDIAKQLCFQFAPYSLPADFHFQKLLFELKIKGSATCPGIIQNGSQSNIFKSSIQLGT